MGTFKEKYLGRLRDSFGLVYKAAYGNTSTDAKVYRWLGLKPDQIFMLTGGGIGFRHGKSEYVDVGKDFLSQWPSLDDVPVPEKPIPTNALAW